MTILRKLALFALVFSLALPVFAVQNALVTGSVYDQKGSPVAGATVRLINAAIGFSQSATTDSSGNFSFPSVPPAENYLMSVEASGFATAIRPGLSLQVGEARLVVPPFEMQPAEQPGQEIREEAPAAPTVNLDLVSTTVGGVIDSHTLRTLPLANRDFLDLALLIPGTYAVEQGSNLEGASLVVNGARASMNNFLLDGVDNNEYSGNQSLPFQLVEALQEFRVQTSNSMPEFGRSGGAQINSVTRSGSNDFHGTLFWFHRNDALSANQSLSTHRGGTFDAFVQSGRAEDLSRAIANFFFFPPAPRFFPNSLLSEPRFAELFDEGRTPPLIQNQFGANLGGPIKKDKVFFFLNWESFRAENDRPVFERVPNLGLRDPGIPFDESTARINRLFNLYPAPNVPPSTLRDPIFNFPVSDPFLGGFDSCGGFGRNVLDPMLPANPSGCDPTGAFTVGESENHTRSDNFLARLDARPSGRTSLSFKYNIQEVRQTQGGSLYEAPPYPGNGIDVNGRNQNFGVNFFRQLTDRLHNEFRFAWNRFELDTRPLDRHLDASVNFDNLNFRNRGLPTVLLGGVFSFGGDARLGGPLDSPVDRANNVWQFSDQGVFLWGRHTLKFGGEVRHVRLNVRNEGLGRGVLTLFGHAFVAFTGAPDLASIARVDDNFHAGRLGTIYGPARGGFDRSFSSNSLDLFFQDTWRIRDHFSITYGVRYEANQAPREARNRLVNHYPGTCPEFTCLIQSGDNRILSPFLGSFDPVAGFGFGDALRVLGTGPRPPRAGYDTDWNNFAPHIGMAWDPFKNGKTVIRAAYGIFYDQESFQPSVNMLHNPPFVQQIHSNFPFFLMGDTFAPAAGLSGFFGSFGLGYVNFGGPSIELFDVDGDGNFSLWSRGPYSITTIDPDRRTPYVHQWNVGFQVQVGGSSIFEAAYVGAAAHKLARSRLILGCDQAAFAVDSGLTCALNAFGLEVDPVQALTIVNQENSANSNFHSLQLRFDSRHFRGWTLSLFYQWAKSIDNASSLSAPTMLFPPGVGNFLCGGELINCDQFSAVNTASNPALNLRPGLPLITTRPLFPQDSGNLAGERGVSDFDVRHRFIIRSIYDVPKWEALRALGSGWQLASITSIQSGQPFTVFTDFFGLPLRPTVIGNPNIDGDNPNGAINGGLPVGCNTPLFPCPGTTATSAFDPSRNAQFLPGGQGRNNFTGDGLVNLDFSILKNTYVGEGERYNIQFRVEFFNLFNTSNYRLPYSQAGQTLDFTAFGFGSFLFPNPFFGQILQARQPREVQFGLKFIF